MYEEISAFFQKDVEALKEKLIPELLAFCRPFFDSEKEAEEFVLKCENHSNPAPKRALHQLQRHMTLANEMEKIQVQKETFQVFFWIVAIEAMYKASTKFAQKQKIEVIRDFFRNCISEEDKLILIKGIQKHITPYQHTTIEIVADLFNTVRNMFAHEGIYWMFNFAKKQGESTISFVPKERTSKLSVYTMGSENIDAYTVSITKEEVQHIVIKGSIGYIQQILNIIEKDSE